MAKHKEMSAEMSALMKGIRAERDREERKDLELKSITDRIDEKARKLKDLEKNERYFFDNLYYEPGFVDGDEFVDFLNILPKLAIDYKRTAGLYLTFVEFIKNTRGQGVYTLNKNVVSKIIERYLEDLNILKIRYECPKVQLPQIAGLMTNFIVKYRPVVPLDVKNDPNPYINELFAIHHALCICSDFSAGAELKEFENSEKYLDFVEDMLYLINRNFTPESLIVVFKTLCLYQFRSFLKKDVDG